MASWEVQFRSYQHDLTRTVSTARIQYFVQIYLASYVTNLADRRVHIRPKYVTLSNTIRGITAVLMKIQTLRCGAVIDIPVFRYRKTGMSITA